MRKVKIQESTGYPDAAVYVTGGQVDLGTNSDPGGNLLNVNGLGAHIANTSGNPVPMVGDTLAVNGTTVTSKKVSNTSLAFTPSSSVYGQSVTFTATVAPATPGDPTPTGTVAFFDHTTGATLGSATLSGGVATISTTALVAGTNDVAAIYSGNSTYLPSLFDSYPEIDKASTTTAVTSLTNPSIYSGPVTFKATIGVVSPGAGNPTGTVEFYDVFNGRKTDLGHGVISSGVATLTTSALGLGTHTITAKYLGDSNFAGSNSANLSQTVNQAASSSKLSSSSAPAVYGQPITWTVTVSPVSPATATPTGSVEFSADGTDLGPGGLDATGKATFTTTIH